MSSPLPVSVPYSPPPERILTEESKTAQKADSPSLIHKSKRASYIASVVPKKLSLSEMFLTTYTLPPMIEDLHSSSFVRKRLSLTKTGSRSSDYSSFAAGSDKRSKRVSLEMKVKIKECGCCILVNATASSQWWWVGVIELNKKKRKKASQNSVRFAEAMTISNRSSQFQDVPALT